MQAEHGTTVLELLDSLSQKIEDKISNSVSLTSKEYREFNIELSKLEGTLNMLYQDAVQEFEEGTMGLRDMENHYEERENLTGKINSLVQQVMRSRYDGLESEIEVVMDRWSEELRFQGGTERNLERWKEKSKSLDCMFEELSKMKFQLEDPRLNHRLATQENVFASLQGQLAAKENPIKGLAAGPTVSRDAGEVKPERKSQRVAKKPYRQVMT